MKGRLRLTLSGTYGDGSMTQQSCFWLECTVVSDVGRSLSSLRAEPRGGCGSEQGRKPAGGGTGADPSAVTGEATAWTAGSRPDGQLQRWLRRGPPEQGQPRLGEHAHGLGDACQGMGRGV